LLRFCEDYSDFGEEDSQTKFLKINYDENGLVTGISHMKNTGEMHYNFNYADQFSGAIPIAQYISIVKDCTVCWDKDDITDYENWDANNIYTIEEIAGIEEE